MKEKKKSKVWWGIGSLVLVVIGFTVIPYFIDKYSNKIYKYSLKRDVIDFDNLGPEIVKKDYGRISHGC